MNTVRFRLGGRAERAEWILYLAAAASYVVLGVAWKPLLNWMLGPAWVVSFVWIAPVAIQRLRRTTR